MPVDALNTLRQIKNLVEKYNDLPLMKQILDLPTEVFALQTENLRLRDELADLKRPAEPREHLNMRGPANYYYREGDEVPFCPKCWENEGKPIHLPSAEPWNGGIRRSW